VSALTVRVDVADVPRITLVGVKVAVGGARHDGSILVNVTVPVNPNSLVTVIVDGAEDPGESSTIEGLAEMLYVGDTTSTPISAE
jgi:hypothetical protein